MKTLFLRVTTVAALALTCAAADARASLTRIAGPYNLLHEYRTVVKFDVAFDTKNRVYLFAWGTQAFGPVNGQFISENGAAIGAPFVISAGNVQAGWARVLYSADQSKFIVSYTKIKGNNIHEKDARFVAYSSGSPVLGPEIWIDQWSGGAGTESGIAYTSAGGGRFLVTWWKWAGNPVSFVTAIDGNSQVLGTYQLTNPADGQSDPEIACDPASNRCLVVGQAWGAFAAGFASSTWARFINATTGVPEGADSFYIESSPNKNPIEDQTIAPLGTGNRFMVASANSGAVYGHVATPSASTVGAQYVVRWNTDGGGNGYGGTSLIYNPGTQSTMLVTLSFVGLVTAEEISADGVQVPGTFDLIPNPRGDTHRDWWDWRSKFGIGAANPVSNQFLVLDNDYWNDVRLSLYQGASASVSAAMTSPAKGSRLAGKAQTFTWSAASKTTGYALQVGTSQGGANLYSKDVGVTLSTTVTGLPLNGAPVWVRLLTYGDGAATQTYADYQYSAALPGGDFSGDGTPDILWRHATTGEVRIWSMQGKSSSGSALVGTMSDTNWRIAGTGDFNGDGSFDIVWRHGVTGQDRVWLMNGTAFSSAVDLPTVSDRDWFIAAVADMDGNGKPDLVWRNVVNGKNIIWFMNGTSLSTYAYLTEVPDLSWTIVGAGDFDGDGDNDLVWRNLSTGQNIVWFLANGAYQSYGWLDSVADQNWSIGGLEDRNGDERPDILWRNYATGQNVVWYMNGLRLASSDTVTSVAATDWAIAQGPNNQQPAVRRPTDFDADGQPDILWRNQVTGENIIWYMNGSVMRSLGRLDTVGDTNWKSPLTADFNGDRSPDIFWRNSQTGENIIWLMNGATYLRYERVSTVPTEWQLAGAADFNRDGRTDLFWRNTSTGQNILWFMNGTSYQAAMWFDTVSVDWTMVGAADFNGDGKSDVLWHNTTTGENVVWYLNGTAYLGSGRIDTVPDTTWTIVNLADYDGDGYTDLLWRNATTGELIIWNLRGVAYLRYVRVAATTDITWKIGQ